MSNSFSKKNTRNQLLRRAEAGGLELRLQSGKTPDFVVINVRGFFKELDFDTWKPAEKATLQV